MKPPLVHTTRSKRGFSWGFAFFCVTAVLMIAAVFLNINKMPCGGKKPAAQAFFEGLIPVMMKYRMDLGSFPSQAQGLSALELPPADKALAAKWQGPYIDSSKELLDPWKQPYHYRFPGLHNPQGYDVWSSGPDGQSGTADDIGNWKNP